MTPEMIILALTPLVIWLVTLALDRLPIWTPNPLIIVPILSLIAGWLSTVTVGNNLWLTAGIGLISVFIHEVIKKLQGK